MQHVWEKERCIQGLVRKPEGNSPLERPRCRWDYNIKMDLQEMEWEDMEQIDLDQDRLRALVNAVSNIFVPQHTGNFLTSLGLVSFSRKSLLHRVSLLTLGGISCLHPQGRIMSIKGQAIQEDCLTFNMGQRGSPETSVVNYHSALRIVPQE